MPRSSYWFNDERLKRSHGTEAPLAWAGGPGRRRLSLPLLALLEPVDAALGVDDPLLAAEEGVAYRADLGLELFLRRASREFIAAEAGHDRVVVVGGMDSGFHGLPILSQDCRGLEHAQPQGEEQREVERSNDDLGLDIDRVIRRVQRRRPKPLPGGKGGEDQNQKEDGAHGGPGLHLEKQQPSRDQQAGDVEPFGEQRRYAAAVERGQRDQVEEVDQESKVGQRLQQPTGARVRHAQVADVAKARGDRPQDRTADRHDGLLGDRARLLFHADEGAKEGDHDGEGDGHAHDAGHYDVAAFMDQDQEHDADPEGPTEELRVNQRRDASRYHGKPQTLEPQKQQTDV